MGGSLFYDRQGSNYCMSKKIRYSTIVIVDLESTCWPPGERPKDQESEIIEIGICNLSLKTLKRGDKMSILVKPEVSEVSDYCTELTSLTQSDLDDAVCFSEAIEHIKKEYRTDRSPWGSWGGYDRKTLERQCRRLHHPYPMSDRHMNIKMLFAVMFNQTSECGMPAAMNRLNLPLEGVHHRGGDDAWNVARIAAETLRGGPLP